MPARLLALAKLVVTHAGDSGDQLEESGALAIAGLARVGRQRLRADREQRRGEELTLSAWGNVVSIALWNKQAVDSPSTPQPGEGLDLFVDPPGARAVRRTDDDQA